jgi:hypothetical protein
MFFSKVLRAVDHPYITGPGGRKENNSKPMQGLTMKSIKHHKALQPLFVIMGAGMVFVAAYCVRLASKTTDVNWSKQKDPAAPLNYYENRQFKMLNPLGVDYTQDFTKDRPKF